MTRFAVGDRVMAVVGGGAQAELVVVHERLLMPVPDALDWTPAGGFAEVFTTAHDALFTQAQLHPGERVLVNGAAGGVGVAAVQLAHLAGARVCASVRSERLRTEVLALGADLAAAPDAAAGHGPFDVIVELVGAPNLATDLDGPGAARAHRGHRHRRRRPCRDRPPCPDDQRGHLMSSTLRARPLEEKAICARRVEAEVLPALAEGRLRVPVAAVFSLEEAQAAYDRFGAGDKLGKVVLEVTPAAA